MSMGHKETAKSPEETDAFAAKERRQINWKSGQRSEVKTGFNRRVRRESRRSLKSWRRND